MEGVAASRRRVPPWRRQGGYALLLMVGAAAVAILAILVASLDSAAVRNRRNAATAQALAQAKEALLGHAITYRDAHPGEVHGYLPCPDANNDGSAAPPDSPCGSKGQTVIGRLPYKTLGLPPLKDDAGECLWYAVSGSAKNSPKDDVMNWDAYGRIAVQDPTGNTLATANTSRGAVAVIFAAGPPLGAAARGSGAAGACPGAAANDLANYIDGGYVSPTATLTAIQGRPDSAANNDRIEWITIDDIFRRIKRRSDFPIQIQALRGMMETCLRTALTGAQSTASAVPASLLPAPAGDPPAFNGKLAGVVPAAADCGVGASDPMREYWDKWREQFRYVACAGLANAATVGDPPCLTHTDTSTATTTQCYGVVVFGGERAAGQTRANPLASSLAADYVEGVNLDAFNPAAIPGLALAGAANFTIASPSVAATQDVTTCIRP